MFFCFFNFFIGIQMGSCGDVAVRFRPALIFAEKHAHIVLDKMTEVAKKF
jgi:4-aminobutyrate aminotransferase/(S)-3-amino-2-methylpropionate transaminase